MTLATCRSLFVTGTDTGVGKTLVSVALMHVLKQRGYKVAGMKPVASGSSTTSQGLRNDDALALQRAASMHTDYATVNPYCFAPAIAPHLAAQQAGVTIAMPVLQRAYQSLAHTADLVVVEGAGGWQVPLSTGYLSDFPESLYMEVVMVIGLRLGCINHALLTAAAIAQGPCRLVGWVGNLVDPAFAPLEDNLATLRERLTPPCLGWLPYQHQPDAMTLSANLDLRALLSTSEKHQ